MGHDHALAAITSHDAYRADLPFEEYLLGRGLDPKTSKDYLRELKHAAEWFEANLLDMADALPSQLVAFADTRPNTPSVRGHLRSALRYWWDWRGVQGWPNAIAIPSVANMTCKALEDDQARLLFTKAREIGWRAGTAVEVMLGLALRNEECAGMRWDGFDDNMETYTLVGKKNRQRTLPVAPDLAASLDQHRNGSPWVFTGQSGAKPVSHQTINNWVKKVALEAGITERVWPHRLRHTALASMNDDTKDLRTTQEFAGHARPETTSGYTRTTRKRMRGAAVGLYQRLAGGAWLHSTVADGKAHLLIGRGDQYDSIRADCDPPGEDSGRPFCWQGPDRFTLDEALQDARAHAPGIEPKIGNLEEPDSDSCPDLGQPARFEPLAEVVVLHPKTTPVECHHEEKDRHVAEDDPERPAEALTGTRHVEAENDLAGDAARETLEQSMFNALDVNEPTGVLRVPSNATLDRKERGVAVHRLRSTTTRPGLRAAPDERVESVSPREREVLALLASGVSSTENLALQLGISPKTVKNHLSSIYKKLSVRDRTQAVVEALKLGLADPTMQSNEKGGIL